MVVEVLDFSIEPVGKLQTPQAIVQGCTIRDLGGPSPNKSANAQILTLPFNGTVKNQLFIPYGRIAIWASEVSIAEMHRPSKKVSAFKVAIVAQHFYGSKPPTVYAYDRKGKIVDQISSGKAESVRERLPVMGKEIDHIEIDGVEAAFEQISFFF